MSSQVTTKNRAGGNAFALDTYTKLAQLAVTGMVNNFARASSTPKEEREKEFKSLTNQLITLAKLCDTEYVAKVAVYAKECGLVLDAPVILVAHLSTRKELEYFYTAFKAVVNNVGQLRKFVKIIRSGYVGRKSLGSAPKKAIQHFFNRMDSNKLFWQAQGTSPSIGDVIKLSHPRPNTLEKDNLFAYFIDKEYELENLPNKVKNFENFKSGDTEVVPDVPFLRLTNLNLTLDQWENVFRAMTWNQLRKSLATAARKGLFKRERFTRWVAAKLRDPEVVSRSKVMPMSILSTLSMVMTNTEIPEDVKAAITNALEISLSSAPVLTGKIAILVDTSGSMRMGVRAEDRYNSSPSRITYRNIAAIFASALLKANPSNVEVIPFDTQVHATVGISAEKSLVENATTLARFGGGGTNVAVGLQYLLKKAKQTQEVPDLVYLISDNESWIDRSHTQYRTNTFAFWNELKKFNPEAKMVCHNIADGLTTQVPSRKDILNIGGWTDTVFELIDIFYNSKTPESWVEMIQAINLN